MLMMCSNRCNRMLQRCAGCGTHHSGACMFPAAGAAASAAGPALALTYTYVPGVGRGRRAGGGGVHMCMQGRRMSGAGCCCLGTYRQPAGQPSQPGALLAGAPPQPTASKACPPADILCARSHVPVRGCGTAPPFHRPCSSVCTLANDNNNPAVLYSGAGRTHARQKRHCPTHH